MPFELQVSPNDHPPTTSSEEVSGLGSVAKCARLLGGNVGALGNVAKDVNKMCYNSGLDSPTLSAAVVQPSDATNALKKRRATSLRVQYRGSAASLFAYEAVGWIGIGVLGLVIAFISVRVELEHDAPIGGTRDAAVYGAMLREREQMDGAGRAAKETEKTSNLRTTFVAKVVGAAFVLVGFGGFFLFQLPRRH